MRYGRILTGKRKIFLLEPAVDSTLRKPQHDLAEIVQITGQAIHRVADDGVTFPHIFHKLLELRAVHVSSLTINVVVFSRSWSHSAAIR